MNYYLLDENLNIIDIIEGYKSVIWTTRYYEPGDFELYMPCNISLVEKFKLNYYVVRDDDYTQAMIIEDITIETDIENGDFIIVRGKSLKSILHRRIIWAQTNVSGYVEACVRHLINISCINPTITERKIDNLILGAQIGITDTMSAQYTGDNLGEVIVEICKTYKLGYDIMLDLEEKQFIFILFKGANRSYNQTENTRVIFSNEFENLLRTNYNINNASYKNVVLVAGEGEGVERKKATVGSASGLNRYELFVDARDVSSNEGEITTAEYNKLLLERGNEALSESVTTSSIDGEVETNYTYKLNEDYFLGDVVEVVNEYGITKTPRIIEVIESEDDTGKYTIPTFATDEV